MFHSLLILTLLLISSVHSAVYYVTVTERVYVTGPQDGTSTVFPSVFEATYSFSSLASGSSQVIASSTGSNYNITEAAITIPTSSLVVSSTIKDTTFTSSSFITIITTSSVSSFVPEGVSSDDQLESVTSDEYSSSTSPYVSVVVDAQEVSTSTSLEDTDSAKSVSTTLTSVSSDKVTSTSLPSITSTSVAASSSETSSIYKEIDNYTGSYDLNETFATIILDAHNLKRAQHTNTSALSWSSDLFEYAAEYASSYDCSGTLVHSGGPYGENLAIGYTTQGTVDAWYNEGVGYDYSTCNVLDHFTAVVWQSTTQVGCFAKYCNEVWGSYVICSYNPEGNVVGYGIENIMVPISA